ncbi:uncharacterized protein STEHIDRAFT_121842 [Stereum hirsutum FP-91666 SS1]|uniref:uncharacterized protein n=1 Tax=Stereum hirsutum (strain FP-91666) TaxID=721885 RepID=UPI00044495A8|nr:uncharacterized protein STEHIDRAFT_121842 [Stereum hirsutum FP-91666 SS1]EIM85824.1 hypothetical protein STEHIDRAFT_121842 [Stereum hirsutum FP-91666 SS1]
MSQATALSAKEKGNAAFKAGDFAASIGHYTSAILADPNDPTFPLNRAAAYLKLGKHEDAERDCSRAIQLSGGKNVKALFRRSQARVALHRTEDARKDLEEAASLEPKNQAITTELQKINSSLQKDKGKVGPRAQPISIDLPPLQSQQTRAPHPKRRRIPIEIVEPSSPTSASTTTTSTPTPQSPSLLNPVSTRPLSSNSAPQALPTSEQNAKSAALKSKSKPTPTTFKEAKQAREASRPGGGALRASGSHTLSKDHGENLTGDEPSETKPDVHIASGATVTDDPRPPNTITDLPAPAEYDGPNAKLGISLFTFSREWDSHHEATPEDRWKLLSQIPPPALPTLFQTSLEPSLLSSILTVLRALLSTHLSAQPELKSWVRAYMVHFARVPRFGTIILFTSKAEKEVIEEVWRAVGEEEGDRAERKKWGLKW